MLILCYFCCTFTTTNNNFFGDSYLPVNLNQTKREPCGLRIENMNYAGDFAGVEFSFQQDAALGECLILY